MNRFTPGKLYTQAKGTFPYDSGLRNNMLYKPGENIDNPSVISDNCIMLVLELIYTQRYKLSMKRGMAEPLKTYMWHMKVMINDQIGYVSQWEDQWEEISAAHE